MKRRIAAAAATLCLLLTGCGSTNGEEPYDAQDVQTLLEAELFSESLEEVDSSVLYGLYGLDAGLMSSSVAYLSTGATAEEVALFILNDAEDADTVQTACEKRVADQITACESYNPAEVTKLEGAVISVRDNTVLLVVGQDPAAVRDAVDKL